MRYLLYLILLIFVPPFILGAVGFFITFSKLERMRQIRGWKPGAIVKQETVREKFLDDRFEHDIFWIRWTDGDIRRPGSHRFNTERSEWNKYQVGDPIELVFLPGEDTPYTRDGIFASDGNFAVDNGFLAAEIVMISVSVLLGLFTLMVLLILEWRWRRVEK